MAKVALGGGQSPVNHSLVAHSLKGCVKLQATFRAAEKVTSRLVLTFHVVAELGHVGKHRPTNLTDLLTPVLEVEVGVEGTLDGKDSRALLALVGHL